MRNEVPALATPHAPTKGEHVRVVPLHYPKPSVAVADLAKAKGPPKDADTELFDGAPHAAPASALLTYRGGALIKNVEIFTVFWGSKWDTAPGVALIAKLNAFFDAVVKSPLIDQLAEYDVPGWSIGHGKFTGTKTISAAAPKKSVSDSSVRTHLKSWIKAATVPVNNPNTLYFVFLDPNVVSIMGGSKSCSSFCGYHDSAAPGLYYAVMPYPSCAGCLGGMNAFDALTGTSSHELCEAITDPVPGEGWYDDDNGEIGDICAWSFKKVAGYNVQLEWSNEHRKCM